MNRKRLLLLAGFGVILVLLIPIWKVEAVSGVVQTSDGAPLNAATVRIKTTGHTAATNDAGRFALTGFPPASRTRVTAWQEGYYVGGANAWPWDTNITITLAPYTVPDNPDYEWIHPAVENRSSTEEWFTQTGLGLAARLSFNRVFLPLSERLTLGCRDCHGQTIYDQWAASAHALGSQNSRFLTMYNGTDVNGNQSPPTSYGHSRDYGTFPLRPDPTKPYYGPGYKLDFPGTAGNCAACHLPGAALETPYGVDPNQVTGVDAQGTHCDFCHKIAAVKLNPDAGQPYENMPGVLSLKLMRPSSEPQIFFGPYDDVDVGPDTYLPLMKQSEICAPCHSASFWGVPIYQSFAEWRASPYPAQGVTCQDCHLEPDGVTTNFAPGRGGLERAAETIPTHHFPGAGDETLLQNAVTLDVQAARQEGQVVVTVTLTNDKTGHHVPTGSPLRHLILLVQVTDEHGQALLQQGGATVPAWGGRGDPQEGYYAGLPGTAYAKILEELWTEISPTGAYWNQTRVLSDNRIPALGSDTTTYTFAAPDNGQVNVEVTLLFRRAFMELAVQKGWGVADIVMAQVEATTAVPPSPLITSAPASGAAATYYIRTDGGTANQCTGLVDAAYSGSGTSQPCAWNHPFQALPPDGAPRIASGNTLVVAGGSYMMGYGAPGAEGCDPDGAFDCYMPPIPSGPDSANPTRILGAGWNTGCATPPELWGTQRANIILNLTGSSNVEVACLELTDHSGCVEFHTGGLACERDTYPFGDWAATGLHAEDSANVHLWNLDIHGLANGGIHAGRLHDWTVEDVRIAGNGWVGWDGDLAGGDSNTGTLLFRHWTVEWNGCGETYPGEQPSGCWGQTAGGYGDGVGTGDTGGNWIIEDSAFLHNTSDGLDLLYHSLGGSITLNRVRAEGNAGNQIKVTGQTALTNSVLVGNCAFFEGQPFTYNVDNCRALGNTLEVVYTGGEKISLVNNTFYGQGDGLVSGGVREGFQCNGSEKLTGWNNIFVGDIDYFDPGDISFLFYQEGCGSLTFEGDYSLAFTVKNTDAPYVNPSYPSTHNLLQDPLLAGPFSGEAYGMTLTAGSPALDAGDNASCPGADFLGRPRPVDGDGNGSALCDMGAFEWWEAEAWVYLPMVLQKW